jgi:beta-lactam-binding protein with PASTA domain
VLKFITGKPLWANIVIGCAIFLLLFVLLMQSLGWITRHDAVLPVPAVTGKSFEEAKKLLEGQGFEVLVQDTVFTDTAPLLSVMRQFPEAESIVKESRTIFLTINRDVPPDIPMPSLEGSTYRSAEISITQHGLKLEDTIYKKDYARNMVLEQLFKGERIKAGTKIPMGSPITLVLGTGLGNEAFEMPDLFGLTLSEAKGVIESSGLTMGNVIPGTAHPGSYVYKQSPDHQTPTGNINQVRQGQLIDIWVQTEKPVRAAAPADTSATSTGGY